jgi:FtsP/CotA-like multicopper oxidase with cupredoxin domain
MTSFLWSLLAAFLSTPAPALPAVESNANQHPAGRLAGSDLTVRLVAGVGTWRPEGARGAAIDVAAFGEEGRGLSTPGPLIRAREGTTVVVSIRNSLASPLTVHGLCARPAACDPMLIAPAATRELRFVPGAPGTYFYWAATSEAALPLRPAKDTQLNGAIVVDPREGPVAPDRVFVVSMVGGICGPEKQVAAINGAPWPASERLHYAVGDAVRWRVVNASCDQHAFHLHGFHFTVEGTGDGDRYDALPAEQQRTEVTEALRSGRTFTLAWTPGRAGNWLFHCHMVAHMTPEPEAESPAHAGHEADAGMAGLVLGIEVTGTKDTPIPVTGALRRFSLVLSEEPNRYGTKPGFRADVDGTEAPRLSGGPVPGPVLVLQRGQPTEITVVNRMTQATAIHWHGIEIESYFDGVPGFGGKADMLAPPIAPGDSFVAKMTPPRAGTFIYHTHWHDEAQLAGGLYGALIVLEPGERYDPATDHVFIIGLNGVLVDGQREPFAINGQPAPAPVVMRAGVPNRIRLINITPNNVALTAFLVSATDVVQWKPIAKDGARIPLPQTQPRPARQQVSVGETYDFEYVPKQNLWLEFRRGNGEWVLQAPIQVR